MAINYIQHLVFLEDDWEPLLANGSFSNIIIITNQEGRPNTPSQRALCRRYPQLLCDMMLNARPIWEQSRVITHEPIITTVNDAAFFHVASYPTESLTGLHIDIEHFRRIVLFIVENYVRETPEDTLFVMLPPDRGDPNYPHLLWFLDTLCAQRNIEIVILQES